MNYCVRTAQIKVNCGSIRFFSHRNNSFVDYSLGWILGFRKTYYDISMMKNDFISLSKSLDKN